MQANERKTEMRKYLGQHFDGASNQDLSRLAESWTARAESYLTIGMRHLAKIPAAAAAAAMMELELRGVAVDIDIKDVSDQ